VFPKPLTTILMASAIVSGCSQSNATNFRDLAQAREDGLHNTTISGGACDGAGQLIPGSLYGGPLKTYGGPLTTYGGSLTTYGGPLTTPLTTRQPAQGSPQWPATEPPAP
jgi:hypothetical protein